MTFSNDNPNPDFSDVGGSSTKGSSSGAGGMPDFSDVRAGSSSTDAFSGTTYIVKSGDSLSKIAKQFYGDAGKWKKIHAANSDKIPNPDLIHPGLELTIPAA
jgi:nucleoid-associated protein YgaU